MAAPRTTCEVAATIRSVILMKFRAGTSSEQVEMMTQALRDLRVDGCTISNGTDLKLRADTMDFCQVTDIRDLDAYQRWDQDAEHNRVRRELIAPIVERAERCQFEVQG